MGILLTTTRQILDLLLPFTHPDTPLSQDLIHTAILITTLYYAPQIAEYYNAHPGPAPRTADEPQRPAQDDGPAPQPADQDTLVDEAWILRDDGDADVEAPPHAPTPPPGQIPQEDAWHDNPNGEGPAANDRPVPTRANRAIGAKKAKSLARRDQRRAYYEFHRSQAEQRRAAEEAGREEREAKLAAEKARRAEAEREIAEEKREERARKREEERREAEEELRRRERVVERVREQIVRKGAVDLVGVAVEEGKDKVWVERLVRASGMIAQIEKGGQQKAMITGEGWLVRIDKAIMEKAYVEAAEFGDSRDGRVSFADFGGILERAVRARAEAAA